MKKKTKGQFAFPVSHMSRSEYLTICIQCGFDILDDDQCLDLFAFYNEARDGKGPATKIAFMRGYTIADPKDINKIKTDNKIEKARKHLFN